MIKTYQVGMFWHKETRHANLVCFDTESQTLTWYWRPIDTDEDFAQARRALRERIGHTYAGPITLAERGEIALLSLLLEGYEMRVSLERADVPSSAAFLETYLEQSGCTQAELGERLGVGQAKISQILRGTHSISRSLGRALLEDGARPGDVLAVLLAPKRDGGA